jgi:hypothetical protein
MADDSEQGLLEIIPLEGGLDTISLRGSALPYKGAVFGTEQRIKTTYYPGNPVASQQVGGPIKPNTTFHGRWMDVDLGTGGARSLQIQIEYLSERAIPVEVRWGGRQLENGVDPAIVRRGLIKKFDPAINRAQDIEWTMECEWRGEAIQTKAPSFASTLARVDKFEDLSTKLSDTLDAIQAWRGVALIAIQTGTSSMLVVSDALAQVENDIGNSVMVVNGATTMLAQAEELPSEVADRVRSTCSRVKMACAQGRGALSAMCGLAVGPEQVTIAGLSGLEPLTAAILFKQSAASAKLAMFPTDEPLTRLDGQTAQNALFQVWDLLAEQAVRASAMLASHQVPDVLAVVRPSAGSDLRDLAMKYYTDPDLWILIADFNDLDSSEVPAWPTGPSDIGGPPILIPVQTDYATVLKQTWGALP